MKTTRFVTRAGVGNEMRVEAEATTAERETPRRKGRTPIAGQASVRAIG